MIEPLLTAASSYARDIDNLILLVAVLVGFWFVLCEGVFFWFIWKYRASNVERSDYVTGAEPELKRWISIPHMLVLVCDVFIIIGAVRVWYDVKQYLPPPDETIRVVAQQWAWSFVHPGADAKLGTDDDIKTVDELHLQVGKTYHYTLEARDVLHNFSIPVFRLKQDAVPGRVITGWFEPTRAGTYDLQCAEICGLGHGLMAARVYVETPEQHAAWQRQHSPSPEAVMVSAAQ